METLVVVGTRSFASLLSLPRDASHHFGDEHQVDDQWGSEQGVLAHVEKTDGLVSTHEDLRVVLIQGALVVAYSGHVLDHDSMVGVLAWLVEHAVSLNHIVHDVGLGDFLGAELLLRTEIHAIVIAEVIVAGDRSELDAGVDHEVDQGRLHLGLTGFEVVTPNECTVLLCELNRSWDKGILRRAIDERSILKDTSYCEDGRWGDLFMALLNGLEQVVSGVIDTIDEVGVTFCVSSPLHYDLVKAIGFLEITRCNQSNAWSRKAF